MLGNYLQLSIILLRMKIQLLILYHLNKVPEVLKSFKIDHRNTV